MSGARFPPETLARGWASAGHAARMLRASLHRQLSLSGLLGLVLGSALFLAELGPEVRPSLRSYFRPKPCPVRPSTSTRRVPKNPTVGAPSFRGKRPPVSCPAVGPAGLRAHRLSVRRGRCGENGVWAHRPQGATPARWSQYVALSRARHRFEIVCSRRDLLPTRISRSMEKEAALTHSIR
jgi:hypothetical protein